MVANSTHRVVYAKQLKQDEAPPYLDISYIDGEDWLVSTNKKFSLNSFSWLFETIDLLKLTNHNCWLVLLHFFFWGSRVVVYGLHNFLSHQPCNICWVWLANSRKNCSLRLSSILVWFFHDILNQIRYIVVRWSISFHCFHRPNSNFFFHLSYLLTFFFLASNKASFGMHTKVKRFLQQVDICQCHKTDCMNLLDYSNHFQSPLVF